MTEQEKKGDSKNQRDKRNKVCRREREKDKRNFERAGGRVSE